MMIPACFFSKSTDKKSTLIIFRIKIPIQTFFRLHSLALTSYHILRTTMRRSVVYATSPAPASSHKHHRFFLFFKSLTRTNENFYEVFNVLQCRKMCGERWEKNCQFYCLHILVHLFAVEGWTIKIYWKIAIDVIECRQENVEAEVQLVESRSVAQLCPSP